MLHRSLPAFLLFLTFAATPVLAETRVGGDIVRDTRWTKAASPYLLTQDLNVKKTATLTIEPGVRVEVFRNVADRKGELLYDAEIFVEGKLMAVGTAADSIEFTVRAKTPAKGDWAGILFRNGGTGEIGFANIRWGLYGVDCLGSAPLIHDSKVTKTYSTALGFRDAEATVDKVFVEGVGHTGDRAYGIMMTGAKPVTVRNCVIIGCEVGISVMQECPAVLIGNTVTLCRDVGIAVKYSDVTLTGNTLTENEVGLTLTYGAKGKIHRNNIYDNGRFNCWLEMYKPPAVELDLSQNWWGFKSVPFVEERIWDGNDNGTIAATVKTDPILMGPVEQP